MGSPGSRDPRHPGCGTSASVSGCLLGTQGGGTRLCPALPSDVQGTLRSCLHWGPPHFPTSGSLCPLELGCQALKWGPGSSPLPHPGLCTMSPPQSPPVPLFKTAPPTSNSAPALFFSTALSVIGSYALFSFSGVGGVGGVSTVWLPPE